MDGPAKLRAGRLARQHSKGNKYVLFFSTKATYLLYCLSTETDMRGCMKYSEFRRWLAKQGAEFTPGKGSHYKVTLNDKSTVFPDHGAKEIGTGLVEKIKKDLGLK